MVSRLLPSTTQRASPPKAVCSYASITKVGQVIIEISDDGAGLVQYRGEILPPE
jgi:hypothetical protein